MAPYYFDDVEIKPMTSESSQATFLLACEIFVDASILHSAVGITIEEYREYLQTSFDSMWNQGLSLVAIDRTNNELIGCLLACDYGTQEPSSIPIPNKLRPVTTLLNNLDKIYRENRHLEPGKYMLVDMAVVKSTASGRGVYRILRETAHQVGREAGFGWVVGELSSVATQHVCINRFGHKICAEIEYGAYKYMGKKPFAAIKEPSSIVLVEGEL